jgi:hypothetical protein
VGGYKGTSGGSVPCPTGTTTTTPGTGAIDSRACDNLTPGYFYTGAAGVSPAQINRDNVQVCTKGFTCDGATAITTLSAVTGRTACPAGTTTLTAAITNIDATFCKILLPTWYHNGQATDVTTSTIKQCPMNGYCPGSCASGTCVEETYSDAATAGITSCPGYTCAPATVAGDPAVCSAQSTAPIGGSGTTADKQSSVSGCNNLDAGWYYNPGATKLISDTTIVKCPVDKWCDGSATITLLSAVTGITGTCPTAGTTSPEGSDEAEDCYLVAGYYYTGIGSVLNENTVLPCKPGPYFCDAPSSGAFTLNGGEQGLSACDAGKTCMLGTDCTETGDCS